MLKQFGLDLGRVGTRLVDFVDRDNHRNTSGLGMADGLNRLRHDRVIGSNNQNHDIGDLRTARTHFGKCGVARGIDEGDLRTGCHGDLIGTDMLGNATGFAAGNVG